MNSLFHFEKQDIPSIVLIHGLGSNHRSWKFQMDYFSKRCRVVVGDTRWHGKSKSIPIPARYSIKQYADDWWKLIEKLRLRHPFVMGTGMGSSIALQIVIDHPDSVGGVVLINSWSHCDDDFLMWLQKWMKIAKEEGTDGLARFVIPHLFSKDFIQEKPEVVQFYSQVREEQEPEAIATACKACMKFDVRDRLNRIKIPTLLIAGEYDVVSPPYRSKFILEKVPHAKYVKINGSGHMPFLEKPSEFNRIVLDFVNTSIEESTS